MEIRNGEIILTEEEARIANYRPRFPLGEIPAAIDYMRHRQNDLQANAETRQPPFERVHHDHMEPLSRAGFYLGKLIDQLEQLR